MHEDQLYNDSFSVRDILAVIPAFYPTWSAETADRLVTRFRLPLDTKSKQLSRGQRSALAITLSLASRAAYTFWTSPISARRQLALHPLRRVARRVRRAPRTFIISTHLIDEVADLMEEVVVLEDGVVAVQTDVDEARAACFIVRGHEAEVRTLVGDREIPHRAPSRDDPLGHGPRRRHT